MMIHNLVKVRGADFCDGQFPVISTVGRGPKGEQGEQGKSIEFADPIEWSSAKSYEPLTIVLHEGNSYTSKQAVPKGIAITNEAYWALTGNYNAQIELYRRDTAHALEVAEGANEAASAAQNGVSELDSILPKSEFDAENPVKKYIDDLVTKYLQAEYGSVDFTGTLENVTKVHYAIIPSAYKPKLRIANGTVNTVEHEIKAANRNKSIVLINAGVFNTSTSATEGVVVADGQVEKNTITTLEDRTTIFMREDGTLASVSSNITGNQLKEQYGAVWAVTSFYPFIVDGEFTQDQRTPNDFQPRTCIAQDYEGNYCVFSCAGRKQFDKGMSIFDMRDFLTAINFNAKFAYNLDGGASSSLSVMGVRTNRLTDNNHRPVANFISFELDEPETLNQVFDGNYAIADMLIQLNTYVPQFYGSSMNQFVNDGGNISNSFYDVNRDSAAYVYTAVLTEAFQQVNGLYRLLMRVAGGDMKTALSLNTQYEEASMYGRYALTRRPIEILSWGSYGVTASGDTYDIANTLQQCVSFVAIVEQSGKQQYVHLYDYALGVNLGNKTAVSQRFTAPDGQLTGIEMQINYTTGKVTLMRVGDTSGAGINVRKLVGLEWW